MTNHPNTQFRDPLTRASISDPKSSPARRSRNPGEQKHARALWRLPPLSNTDRVPPRCKNCSLHGKPGWPRRRSRTERPFLPSLKPCRHPGPMRRCSFLTRSGSAGGVLAPRVERAARVMRCLVSGDILIVRGVRRSQAGFSATCRLPRFFGSGAPRARRPAPAHVAATSNGHTRSARAQRRGAVRGSAGIIGAGRSWTAAMISVLSIPRKYRDVIARSACPRLSLNHEQRDPFPRHLDGMSMSELVLVPTSAQASLGRPGRYADGGREVAAEEGSCAADVGIFRGPRGTSGACRGADSGPVWRRGVWPGRSPAACGSCRRAGRCWSSRVARGRARGR